MHCFIGRMLLTLLLFLPGSAWAAFEVCNDTQDRQHVAFSHKVDGVWTSKGWWPVAVNACVTLIAEELSSRFIYLRLRDRGDQFMHTSVKFCASPDDFTGTGSDRCPVQRLVPLDFSRINVGRGTVDATVQLSTFLRDVGPTDQDGLVLEAVFQSCRRVPGTRDTMCSFVGRDREILARLTTQTPRTAVRRLTHMHSGAPVRLKGRLMQEYLNTIEVAVEMAERRTADTAHELLVGLQGGWVSRSDPNDTFTVDGATRLSFYLGAATSREFISVSEQCLDFDFQGYALHSWSKDDTEGLCYQIERLTEDHLELRFLPSGRQLSFERRSEG